MNEVVTATADLREENMRRATRLMQEGATFDALTILGMRLDVMIDFLFTEEQREQFNLLWEQTMDAAITAAEAEVRKAKLMVGGMQQSLADVLDLEQERARRRSSRSEDHPSTS